jgi:branched-chain amino acid transport system substrate-binding protein
MMMRGAMLLAALLVPATAQIAKGQDPPPQEPTAERYGRTPDEYVPYGRFAEPYKRFFLDRLEYTGYGRQLPEPTDVGSVKIGFIGPIEKTVSMATGGASHEEVLGRKMLQGAQLAIEQANAKGGFRGTGTPYELVVRNDNGLWGASGSEVIQLAYRDEVWAILGTIDGANTHIAIRVALKAEIPIMNTGDTDPTLMETAIPWVFRTITDDRQMCYLLADFVFKKLGLTRVAALRANNRYGRIGIDEFRDAARRLGHPFVAELNYPVGEGDFMPQLERILALRPEADHLRQRQGVGTDPEADAGHGERRLVPRQRQDGLPRVPGAGRRFLWQGGGRLPLRSRNGPSEARVVPPGLPRALRRRARDLRGPRL